MDKQFFLTNKAETDLEHIVIYTINEWGEKQVYKYGFVAFIVGRFK